MADDGEIKRQDVADDDAIKAPLELAANYRVLEVQIDKALLKVKEYNTAIGKADSTSALKKETDGLKASTDDLKRLQEQVIKVQQNTNAEYIAQVKALQNAKQALKDKIALGDQDAKTINKQNSSLKELNAALNINRAAYASLTDEEKRNSETGKQLLKTIEQQAAEVDELKSSMGQHQQRVGDYEGAMKGLKEELRLAKDEMVAIGRTLGVDSEEYIQAAEKAGALNDELGDMQEATKAVTGEPIERFAGSFDQLKGKLGALDFKGATNAIRGMSGSLAAMSWKSVIEGAGGFGKAMLALGKALLTNPIILLATVIIGIGTAIFALKDKVKFISDAFDMLGVVLDFIVDKAAELSDALLGTSFAADAAAKETIAAAKEQAEAVGRLYDRQIKLAAAAGKSTTELEEKKAQAMAAAYKVAEENYAKITVLSEEEQKERLENTRNMEDAMDDQTAARLQSAQEQIKIEKEKAKALEELRLQEMADLYELEQFRRQVIIDGEAEIYKATESSFTNRLNAANVMYEKSVELAKAERDNTIKQKNITDAAVILAEERYQVKRLELQKKYLADVKALAVTDDPISNATETFLKNIDLQEKGLKHMANFRAKFTAEELKHQDTVAEKWDEIIEKIGKDYGEAIGTAIVATGMFFQNAQDKLTAQIEQEKTSTDEAVEREEEALERKLKREQLTEEEVTNLKEMSSKRIEALEEASAKRQEILEKKRRESIRKQAVFEKSIMLVQSIAAGISAVTKAFTAGPFVGAAMALSYGALIAAQIAKLKQLTIPAAARGLMGHKGGPIIAGERGYELVEHNGTWSMTGNRAALYNLPQGSNVYDNKKSMRMLAAAGLAVAGQGDRQYGHSDKKELIAIREAIEDQPTPWKDANGRDIGYKQKFMRVKQLDKWRNRHT
jgi:hypothetical protein